MVSEKFNKNFDYERSEGNFIMPSKHYHNLYEIYFLEKGKGSYFIDNKSYDIQSGDVVFIPPGTVHKTIYDEERIRQVVYCSGRFIPASVIEIISDMFPVYRNPGITEDIKEYFFRIEQEYKKRDSFSDDTIRCLLQLMLIHIAKHKNTCISLKSQNDLVSDVAEFIKSNLANSLSLSEISKRYAVTPQYLSSLFKKKTGIGFHEYINLLRMLKAEELLISKIKYPYRRFRNGAGLMTAIIFPLCLKNISD